MPSPWRSPPPAADVRGVAARPANVQSARTGVANRNVNVNQNVNVNRNVNVNDNRGYRGGGCCYDNWGHPVAAAVAVTATAVAVGTVAASLPGSGCSGVSVGGVSYQKCGPNTTSPSSRTARRSTWSSTPRSSRQSGQTNSKPPSSKPGIV